jgi:nucleotide-binding universal stress UspA family protein
MTAVEMLNRGMEEIARSPDKKIKSIVVATDGSDAALSAFRAANLICSGTDASVRVVSVLEPLPITFPSAEGMMFPPSLDESRREAQRAIVFGQMEKFDVQGSWPLDIALGRPGDAIAEYARNSGADLIIIGTNKHGVLGRIFGEETATDIARLSEIPLLVASPLMTRLPKRVAVAMDLHPDGMRHTHKALRFLTDAASVSCVHVKPRSELLGIDWAEFDREYEHAMKDRFHVVETSLRSVNLRPDLVVLHGDAAHELVDFATYSKAELLVVGVKRRVGRARAIGGRTARKIIRRAECSVLIVPNVPANLPELETVGQTETIRDSKLWDDAMRRFTARNAGRIVNLEVDDPEIGALVEATQYPLLGVDYDHRDGCVTITLGQMRGLDRHLTRTISNAKSISVLTAKGRDTALSIKHNGGQTLLTL